MKGTTLRMCSCSPFKLATKMSLDVTWHMNSKRKVLMFTSIKRTKRSAPRNEDKYCCELIRDVVSVLISCPRVHYACIKTCTVTSKVCSFSIFVPFRNLLTCILTSCSTSLLRSSSELLSVALIWWPTRVRYESCSDQTKWSSWSAEARWDIVTCILLVVKITSRFCQSLVNV